MRMVFGSQSTKQIQKIRVKNQEMTGCEGFIFVLRAGP